MRWFYPPLSQIISRLGTHRPLRPPPGWSAGPWGGRRPSPSNGRIDDPSWIPFASAWYLGNQCGGWGAPMVGDGWWHVWGFEWLWMYLKDFDMFWSFLGCLGMGQQQSNHLTSLLSIVVQHVMDMVIRQMQADNPSFGPGNTEKRHFHLRFPRGNSQQRRQIVAPWLQVRWRMVKMVICHPQNRWTRGP